MSAETYRYLWRGELPARAVSTRCDPRLPARPARLVERIDAEWRERQTRAEADGVRLFDGALLGYGSHAQVGDRLLIEGRSDRYAAWLHCSGRQREIAVEFGREAGCRPLALCAAVFTADGFLLLQERSHQVAEGAGLLHVPGGHLDPTRHRNPDRAMREELREELALTAGDLTAADEDPHWGGGRLLGLAEAVASGKPELLFAYRCRLDAAALERRAATGEDRFEYTGLHFAPAAPPALSGWIASRRARLAAPSQALMQRLVEVGERFG